MKRSSSTLSCSFLNAAATTHIYTLSLHDALPISVNGGATGTLQLAGRSQVLGGLTTAASSIVQNRSEEHTSELQSRVDLVCRLLLEKKNDIGIDDTISELHVYRSYPN